MKRLIEEAAIRRSSRPFSLWIMSSECEGMKSGSVLISSLISACVKMSHIHLDLCHLQDDSVSVETRLFFRQKQLRRDGERVSSPAACVCQMMSFLSLPDEKFSPSEF